MKGKVVLGVDPAFRTGCKLAVVDATGKLLEKSVMYPHQKQKGEVVPPARYQAAVDTFCDLINRHNVEVVAMGMVLQAVKLKLLLLRHLKALTVM